MLKSIHGVLLLDKPTDMTSNAALQKVKKLYNARKAGHTGSLDPIATGMLPICFGEATKFSQFLLESDKTYYVTAQLGARTTTGDSEGEIVLNKPVSNITVETVESVLAKFIGEIEQIPPMFSAVKYQGKPLYKLARRGVEVERKPRKVKIFSLRLHKIDHEAQQIILSIHCSKGTYIRTLVEDIGHELGCEAYVKALRRLTITPYGEAIMYTLPALYVIAESGGYEALLASLLPTESAVHIFPAIKLSTSAAFYLRMGQPVRAPFQLNTSLVRLLSPDAKFLGVGEVLPDGRVKPHRLLSEVDVARTSCL